MGKPWTEEEKEFVKDNYLTMTHKKMGKQISRSWFAVERWCSRHGYRKIKLYTVFSDYFKKEKALNVRIRNFLTADGSTKHHSKNSYSLEINLQLEDEHYLIRIRDELAPDRPLTYGVKIENGKKYPYVSLSIYDKDLVKNLIEDWGIEIAKSKNYEFRYTSCADEFKPDALLGLFEGDGCITVGKNKKHGGLTHCFSICSSSKLFLEDIQRELGFGYGGISKCSKDKDGKESNCWSWNVNKRQHIQHLYKFMYYNNNVFCLKRKKDKFKPIMEAGISNTHWSEKEIKFLQENWKEMTNKELAKSLNRTVSSIENRKFKIKL